MKTSLMLRRPAPRVLILAPLFALAAAPTAQEERAILDAPVVQVREYEVPFRRLLDFDADGDLDAVGIWAHQQNNRFKAAAYANDGQGVFTEVWDQAFTLDGTAAKFLIEVGRLNDDEFDDFTVFAGRERFDFLSLGTGAWSQAHFDLVSQTRALAVSDLNKDGIDDHVWVDRDNIRVDVEGVELAVPDGPGLARGLRVLDADGDAYPDLFLTVNAELRVWHGSPTGFTAGAVVDLGVFNFMLDIGDIDGDLDVDAVVFQDSDTPEYRVLRRTGPDSWNLEPALVGGPAEFLRDVDGDGDLDGVCCGGGGGGPPPYYDNDQRSDFQIALNDGFGNFETSFKIEGLGSPQLAGVADVDDDGDIDLVAGRVVYYARGPITRPLTQAPGFDMPPAPSKRSLVDFDDDGDADVGLCLSDVWVNDGNGFFVRGTPAVAAAPGNSVFRGPGFPGDFDNDGLVDLLVEHRARPERASAGGRRGPAQGTKGLLLGSRMLRNAGSGNFVDGGPATPFRLGLQLDSLAAEASVLGDLDADGDLDLVVRTMSRPVESQLWLNDGAGRFLPLERIAGERVERVMDHDLDGVADLLVTREHQLFGIMDQIGLLRGGLTELSVPYYTDISDALFAGAGFRIDGILGGITFDDFSGDGYLDFGVITAPGSGASVAALYLDRRGFGETGYLVNVAVSPNYQQALDASMQSGDVDGDGAIDALLTGIEGGPNISILRTKYDDPSWFFEPFAAQVIPRGVLVDVDGDGDLDVVGDGVTFNRTLP